jgi:hypothetical protein
VGSRPLRLGLLAILGVVLVAVVVWSLADRAPAAGGDGATPAASPSGVDPARAATPSEVVRLEALGAPRPDLAGGERDPFRFGIRTSPPRPEPQPEPPALGTPPAPGMPTDRPGPGGPGGAAPIALKFIGIVDAPLQGGKVAVLSDGRSVFQGHEGDAIDGRFRIVRIGVESIEMAHLDGQGRQTIRLTGR